LVVRREFVAAVHSGRACPVFGVVRFLWLNSRYRREVGGGHRLDAVDGTAR
jgi:hypothetical protein